MKESHLREITKDCMKRVTRADDINQSFLDSETAPLPDKAQQLICQTFNIRFAFWNKLTQDASGFFWATQEEQPHDGRMNYASTFRFLVKKNQAIPMKSVNVSSLCTYTWMKLWFITVWKSPTSSTILCFGLDSEMRNRIHQTITTANELFDISSPSHLHASIVGHIVEIFDGAVWSWRNPVRAIEERRASIGCLSDSYESMHELARHIIHSSETLRTAIVVVESMLDNFGSSVSTIPNANTLNAQKEFNFHLTMLRSLLNRSQALELRLQNEINLVRDLYGRRTGLRSHY